MNNDDRRPPVWVGHIFLETNRLDESYEFMTKIGMRSITKNSSVGILELRGGTHLVLMAKDDIEPGVAPFDLMFEDLESTHRLFEEMGLKPSAIETDRIHQSFTVQEPSGHTIKVYSSHVGNQPV